MKTHFATPERASSSELQREIALAAENPVVDGLMSLVGGLLVVLNEHRQILAMNDTLVELLGLGDADETLGLRLGEALRCPHAEEMAAGCGTSEFCSTCGAAVAMVASLGQDRPIERTCAVTIDRNGKPEDLYFRVRSCPIVFRERRFLLLFLNDCTKQQKWALLDRVFFHDLGNIILSVLASATLLKSRKGAKSHDLVVELYHNSLRLAQEVAIQRSLAQTEKHSYPITRGHVPVVHLFRELQNVFSNHPAARQITLVFPEVAPDLSLRTDFSLLMRILTNMLTNACEASDAGDEIRVSLQRNDTTLTFGVWNKKAIPSDIRRRIFQRNFSTKGDLGRGLGTYAMKLFGEEFLGGTVDFTTSEAEGTEFRLTVRT